MTQQNPDLSTEGNASVVIYGEVVNIRPIPSRGVTQIVIEVPDDHHVQITKMLYKSNAFVMPCEQNPSLPFGVTTLAEVNNAPQTPQAPEQRQAPIRGQVAPNGRVVNITQWLALSCKDADFHRFTKTESEAEAIEYVKMVCDVDSRSNIPESEEARNVFFSQIYTPFLEYRRLNPSNNAWRNLSRR